MKFFTRSQQIVKIRHVAAKYYRSHDRYQYSERWIALWNKIFSSTRESKRCRRHSEKPANISVCGLCADISPMYLFPSS